MTGHRITKTDLARLHCAPGPIERAGDGWTEPRQEWQHCTCGQLLWESEQGRDIAGISWDEHVSITDLERVTGHQIDTWDHPICNLCAQPVEDGDDTRCGGTDAD